MLGANNDVGQTYTHLNQFWGYFFLIWENSIGNINPPTYAFWTDRLNSKGNLKLEDYQEHGTYLIIYIIWFMWLANQILILIVLLNFLIAVISQSYENVMNSSVQFKYKQRCELIRESAILNDTLSSFYSTFSDYQIFVLQANTTNDNAGKGDDWSGFVQTLKTFIKEENNKTHKKLNSNSKKMDQI